MAPGSPPPPLSLQDCAVSPGKQVGNDPTAGIQYSRPIVYDDAAMGALGKALAPEGIKGRLSNLCEEQPTDNGLILNPSFVDYKIIRIRDMPEIELHEVLTHEPEGPFGAKESAEGAVGPTAPAIANAIYNVTGATFDTNVLKPEKVLKAIREAEEKEK